MACSTETVNGEILDSRDSGTDIHTGEKQKNDKAKNSDFGSSSETDSAEDGHISFSDIKKRDNVSRWSSDDHEIAKWHAKRKVHFSDEDVVRAKRKFQLDKEEIVDDEDKHLMSESVLQDYDDTPSQYLLNSMTPAEVEELRQKLGEGYFENYFSWKFWKILQSNHGSTLGYTFGFLLILFLNHEWMLEEFADSSEGHSVAKTFVILFVIYSYSFITLGLEVIQFVLLLMELCFPKVCQALREASNNKFEGYQSLKKLFSFKYFYTSVVVIWCTAFSFIGSVVWKWFWWNHICKSYHDRTCRGSWLGQLVIRYRDEACYDGTASSMICERFVSYLPIMLFSVLFVFLGNVFMPLLNGRMSSYYPLSEILVAAFDMLDRLNESVPTVPSSQSQAKTNPNLGGEDLLNRKSETITDKKTGDFLKKYVPAGLSVILLLLLDWIIVKKLFP